MNAAPEQSSTDPTNTASMLQGKHCEPCEGGVDPLKGDKIKEYMQALSGWQVVEDEKAIAKEYTAKDFTEAMQFMNEIGDIAEAEGHHPDMDLHSWNKVSIHLSTHAIDGLSINDFILAAKIDEMRSRKFSNIK